MTFLKIDRKLLPSFYDMSDLSQQAINAALSYNWVNAISINEKIIEENENDIDALNRLAYAYIQIGEIEKAKKNYRKVLSLDRYNFIAQKNLNRINSMPKGSKILPLPCNNINLSPSLFIEEPGKTKTVSLTHVAPASIISKLHIGETVMLRAKKHSIEVRDQNKNYLGAIPDDIAFRLIRFLKAGNSYLINIKNVQKNCLAVFIREIKRGKRFLNQPTFLVGSDSEFAKENKKRDEYEEEKEENNQDELEE